MKTSTITLLSTLFLAASPVFGQQAEKTLVKAFNVQNYQIIHLDVEGVVELKTWNEQQMRILMTITLQDGTETMLKSLVKTGRYNLESKETDNKLQIVAPGLDKQIKLRNGQDLGEQVSFVVYAPKNVSVITRSEGTTGMVEITGNGF